MHGHSFNPIPCKQAQEVLLPSKVKKKNHSKLIFNENQVIQTSCQKHLSMFCDFKLNFGEHLKYMVHKGNKLLGLLSKP